MPGFANFAPPKPFYVLFSLLLSLTIVLTPAAASAENSVCHYLKVPDPKGYVVQCEDATQSGQLKDRVNTIELDKLKDVCKINGQNCIEECSSRFERFSRGGIGFFECRFLPKDYFS
ncbi:MAG TPA: hypothetical protein V6D25_30980 [Leptolyngbyaceae cyanobacterium]